MEREESMTIVRAISRIVSYFPRHRYGEVSLRIAACAILAAMFALPVPAGANNTIVRMVTNVGSFNVELYDAEAPITVTNFLNYVNRGDYSISVIHRSQPGFVIQGGGYGYIDLGSRYFFDLPKDPPIQNEFSPTRSNIRGTIAMAKTSDPNSATSEWFINLNDNSASLDNTNNSGGFSVFGRVLDPGMSVVDAIAKLKILQIYVTFINDFTQRYFDQLPVVGDANFPVVVDRMCINNDGDGACPDVEDMAPGGDGNGDGIPDRDQANVTTIQTLLGTTATFAAEPMMRLDPVNAVSTSTAISWLTTFKSPPDQSVNFNNGMFNLTMFGNMGATGHTLTVYDGASTRPTRYYAFGPTLDNQTPHWYDFSFDGVTGAEIISDRIILHFVDGKRGDDDLTVNDSITHTGAQAVVTENANSSSQAGGGCSIVAEPSQTSRGGDWIVVSLFLALLALVRRRAHNSRIQRA